jgi:hypothetical protein
MSKKLYWTITLLLLAPAILGFGFILLSQFLGCSPELGCAGGLGTVASSAWFLAYISIYTSPAALLFTAIWLVLKKYKVKP